MFTTFGEAQQLETVDYKNIGATIGFDSEAKKVTAKYYVQFEMLQSVDSVYLDAVNIQITGREKRSFNVTSSNDKIWIHGPFQAGDTYDTIFFYEVIPKQTLYFTGDQIWTQGQGKYTSHWLPSIDDMNDKIEFDLQVMIAAGKRVIANGNLEEVIVMDEKHIAWRFDMDHAMSSYLAAIVVGDFDRVKLTSTSGVPIELYYRPEDSLKAEPTYRYTKEIFDFLEAEIGVPYPWQNYKQVPVRDFLYAGMENTTATIFSEAFVVDSIGFTDRNYVNVNAHEMAHQWFGNLVTETEGTHHWLHEGFATYYALLAEKEIFGTDYYYWKLMQTAEQLRSLSEEGKGQSLLDPKASSLTFYEKGAWALHILKELIGEEAFRAAVKGYLSKHQFKNVTTADFLAEVRAATTIDITTWEADWLRQTAFQADQVYESLTKSSFVNDYFKMSALRSKPLSEKGEVMKQVLTFPNEYLGQEAVFQLASEPIEDAIPYYKLAFASNNLMVRQAIAVSLQEVPFQLKTEFESLLDDPSYVTMENALATLWINFPSERLRYLEKTKYVVGFQNKNIKLLWLAMAISSEAYGASANEIFLSELKEYTSESFSFEVRQQAFAYAMELELFNSEVLKNLLNATAHHNWRFRNYARRALDSLLEDESIRLKLESLLISVSEKEGRYLKTKLEEE